MKKNLKKLSMILLATIIAIGFVFISCSNILETEQTIENNTARATTTATGGTKVEAEDMTKGGQYTGNCSSPFNGVILYANDDKVSFDQYFSNNKHVFKVRGASSNDKEAQVQLKIGGTAAGTFKFKGTSATEQSIEFQHNKGGGVAKIELVCINDNNTWDVKIDWIEINASASTTTNNTNNTTTNNTTTNNTNNTTTTTTTSSGGTKVEAENMTKGGQYTGNCSSPFNGVILYANNDKVSFDQYFSNNKHVFKVRGASSNDKEAQVQLKIGGTAAGTYKFKGTSATEQSIEFQHNKGGGTTTIELICVNDDNTWDVKIDWIEISASASASSNTTTNNTTTNNTTTNNTTTNTTTSTLLYAKWPFLVGAATPTSAFTTSNGQYQLLKHFNVLVAENDMKPGSIMPSSKPSTFPGTYNWTNADKLVSYAKANGKKIRGHVLVWHSQTPDYFFDVSNGTTTMTKATLYDRMEKHIKTVFEHYKGDIGWWDVCNEVVGDNGAIRAAGNPNNGGSWYTKVMENSGLTGINKYEFVLKAFEFARKYADANAGSNVKLYLTDYNIEYLIGKQDEFERVIDYLIANNAPIDGVGFQTHINYTKPTVSEISSAIDRFAAKTKKNGKKLMTQVTELDMSLYNDSTTTTLSDSVLNTRLTEQATKYRQLFDMFKQKYDAGKLDMVLVWGVADGESWLNNRPSGRKDYPLLFDRNYQAKAAYTQLMK